MHCHVGDNKYGYFDQWAKQIMRTETGLRLAEELEEALIEEREEENVMGEIDEIRGIGYYLRNA